MTLTDAELYVDIKFTGIFTSHLTSVVGNQHHLRSLAWISHEIRMIISATCTILWDQHRLKKQFQCLSYKQILTHE